MRIPTNAFKPRTKKTRDEGVGVFPFLTEAKRKRLPATEKKVDVGKCEDGPSLWGTETSCREESSEVKVKVMVITPALMPQPSEVTTGPDVLRDCPQFSLSCMLPGYRNPGKH